MKKRLFKYYPEDFGKLSVKVLHMDLDFAVFSDYSKVKSDLKVKTIKPIKQIILNANNLEIKEVSCDFCQTSYDYQKEDNLLIIKLKKTIPKNKTITIHTETVCKPTKNILEGMYYDETPKNAPPTIITQCQQWGFQRLVPCIDDMTAKCTYTTRITADSRYTNLITNGDVSEKRRSVGKGRDTIKYDNTITPMAPYLFFLGCGTYSTHSREFEYEDGSKFMLELLVPPKSKQNIAKRALDVLFDSIMWIRLFTGKDKYYDLEKKQQLWKLIREREILKKQKKNYSKLKKQIKELAKGLKLGYKYTGTVYREIGMQNSDFGGMENVGNTTITTNRIMPFEEMSDGSLEYMFNVKVHEFYHNLNGSEVTGRSPFEIWLNEAVTVHIEREFFEFIFGEDYSRLGDVLGLLAPGQGTFALDSRVGSMPVEPEGFNDCNELITSVTYVKAPEFVRMVEQTLGSTKFVKGLDHYHHKFEHSNASRADWINSMQKYSDKNLSKMAQGWLKRIGFPIVKVKYELKKNICKITLEQTKGIWMFPFQLAVFDKYGQLTEEKTIFIDKKITKLNLKVNSFGFLSLNRGYSFYGKVIEQKTREQLFVQVRHDNDIIQRYMAFYKLVDEEKTKLLKNSGEVSGDIVNLYYELLTNKELMNLVGAQFLAIFESVEDEKYAHQYQKLYEVKKRIVKGIAQRYENQLIAMYGQYNKAKSSGTYLQKQIIDIKNRQIKNNCLGILSTLDKPLIHKLIKKQITSKSATDRITALRLYLNSSAKDRLKILKEFERDACKNLVSWEMFLYIVGGNDSENYLELIKKVEKSKHFRIDQSNDQRGLYVSMAHNKKKSLQTKEGREFLKKKIIQLAKINEYTTGRMIGMFGNVDKMEREYWIPLVGLIVDILKSLDAKKTPSVYNTLKRILLGLHKSRKYYESKKGKIKV